MCVKFSPRDLNLNFYLHISQTFIFIEWKLHPKCMMILKKYSFFFFWLNHPVSGTTGAPTKSGFEPGRTTRAAKLSQPTKYGWWWRQGAIYCTGGVRSVFFRNIKYLKLFQFPFPYHHCGQRLCGHLYCTIILNGFCRIFKCLVEIQRSP